MFVVIVQFDAKSQHRKELIEALVAYGRDVRLNEPETLRFDIVQDRLNPNRFYLYEVYPDRAAFDVHTQRPGFGPRWEQLGAWLDGPTTHLCSGANIFPPDGDASWRIGAGDRA